MKVELLKDTRVLIEKGGIVDTPSSYGEMLVKNGYAIPVVEDEQKPVAKKTTKKK